VTVTEAVLSRKSVRAFLDKPVPLDLVREILTKASRAPSGGNVQPWKIYVVAGEPLARFKLTMQGRLTAEGELPAEYEVYPKPLKAPYRDYRWKNAEDYYGLVGLSREDKAGRRRFFSNNYQFFGAPLALFCYLDRSMGPPQWSDCGMFLQTLMLLLREAGLDSCAQECWSHYHRSVAELLHPPAELMLFCGLAIGYKDPDAVVNRMEADRAPVEEFCEFVE
jgi:nitroreductase